MNFKETSTFTSITAQVKIAKRPVKQMQQVKIARLFLQSVSNLSHFKLAYLVRHTVVKELLKTTSEKREINYFNRSLLIESL